MPKEKAMPKTKTIRIPNFKVLEAWLLFIERMVEPNNAPLARILRHAEPMSFEASLVRLRFRSFFDVRMLEVEPNRVALTEALTKFFRKPVPLRLAHRLEKGKSARAKDKRRPKEGLDDQA